MSIWSSEVGRAWRRLRPEFRHAPLAARNPDALASVTPGLRRGTKVLYDTTVYIDQLQGRLPESLNDALQLGDTWHSSVAVAELAHATTRMDPRRADYRTSVAAVLTAIDGIPAHRVLNPDPALWREAGMLDGLMARLEGRPRGDRRRTLNDALLLLTARRHGVAVLTRNRRDFDLLQQLVPSAGVLFYAV